MKKNWPIDDRSIHAQAFCAKDEYEVLEDILAWWGDKTDKTATIHAIVFRTDDDGQYCEVYWTNMPGDKFDTLTKMITDEKEDPIKLPEMTM